MIVLSNRAASADAVPKGKRKKCKNCPKMFHARPKGGSPQLFCSDACRKEFHRNGASFGTLREKLPGYIDKAVQKQLGRPTEEEYRSLCKSIVEHQDEMKTIREMINELRAETASGIGYVTRMTEKLRTDFEAYKQGL